ncbi:ankyrin repeat domain-containing protein [Rhodopirellula sp. JC740]|uniref:Ankyrin repeat domain-containing protein n=1 Tax=Rhodopirellula halodulae TaxID=2894198 RepID=A0ABS8NNQ2_9BACT|nr:ankyrin repeat domain-containing protein [Rhodopirellula sp. JC740]MCC9645205.1 ankyrin repeat domain-containing protein [Rhodopirellula sp. JC740]
MRARDLNGRCLLEIALRQGRPDLARRLLSLGADPNEAIGKKGDHLIHLAARTGDIGFLAVLLEAEVSPDARGNLRRTTLHCVTKGEFGFMANMLLENGANPDAVDARGDTPLHLAAKVNSLSIIKLLLRYNADASITNKQLYTPIHNAAAAGNTEVAKLLLDHERAIKPQHESAELAKRVLHVAELHGQHKTCSALAERFAHPAFVRK